VHEARRERGRRSAGPDGEPEPVDRRPGPPEHAVHAELRSELDRALGRIEAPYADVLSLHLRSDLSPSEIAIRLGRSPDTVRSQLRRGLDLLRRALPAGAAAAVVAGPSIAMPGGIAAVRAAVLAEAMRRGAVVGLALPWQAAAAVLLLVVGTVWLAWPDRSGGGGPLAPIALPAAGTETSRVAASSTERAERVPVASAPGRTGGATAAADDADGPSIRVVEPDGAPVAGVELVAVDVPMSPGVVASESELDQAIADARRALARNAPLAGRGTRAELVAEFAELRSDSELRGRSPTSRSRPRWPVRSKRSPTRRRRWTQRRAFRRT
jgi:hypothetical protein